MECLDLMFYHRNVEVSNDLKVVKSLEVNPMENDGVKRPRYAINVMWSCHKI